MNHWTFVQTTLSGRLGTDWAKITLGVICGRTLRLIAP